jgi:hypothetical protein
MSRAGEYAVLAADEDLAWLPQVDQLAIELHGSHGDMPAMIGQLRGAGLAVDLRDDFGQRAAATSSSVAYAHSRRDQGPSGIPQRLQRAFRGRIGAPGGSP